MKQNTKAILIGVLVVIGVLATMIINFLLNRVTMNPAGTVGNTAGNINNGGLFCEYNGYVYFSNANDNGCLYRMKPDETEATKLLDVKPGNILAGGDYLYYFQYGVTGEMGLGNIRSGHDFHRADLDGDHITTLETEVVVTAQLVDNHIYMLIAGEGHPTFRKIKIDKSDKKDLASNEYENIPKRYKVPKMNLINAKASHKCLYKGTITYAKQQTHMQNN